MTASVGMPESMAPVDNETLWLWRSEVHLARSDHRPPGELPAKADLEVDFEFANAHQGTDQHFILLKRQTLTTEVVKSMNFSGRAGDDSLKALGL
jgi:hypothetical protein